MWSIGIASENARYIELVGRRKRFEANIDSFRDFRLFGDIKNSDQCLFLRDLAIFFAHDDNDNRTNYFTPCVCIQGKDLSPLGVV